MVSMQIRNNMRKDDIWKRKEKPFKIFKIISEGFWYYIYETGMVVIYAIEEVGLPSPVGTFSGVVFAVAYDCIISSDSS